MHIDRLDDIVNKYINTYHKAIKVKPVDVKSNTYIDPTKEINNKDPTFKVSDNVRMSKYKNIFAKGYISNWSGESFVIKKVKSSVPWTYFVNGLNGEEIVRTFYENELQKANEKELRIEKILKRKSDKLYVKWKGYDSSFNSWTDKKDIAKTSEYFPKPNSLEENVKVEMDLSNYATKTDIKNSIRIDTSSFAKKVDLASLKTDVDKLDINKLKNVPTNLKSLKSKVHKLDVHKLVPVPVELSKLSDVVKNNVVKKDVYNAKIKNIEDKIPDITNLATNASLNAKINEVKDEIPDITNLATKASLNAKINEVKSEIPNITN